MVDRQRSNVLAIGEVDLAFHGLASQTGAGPAPYRYKAPSRTYRQGPRQRKRAPERPYVIFVCA
jgi:hypothetical protein